MPLLFLVAGMGSWFSLRRRTSGGLREVLIRPFRVTRFLFGMGPKASPSVV
jgi:hypothetical protein